MAYGKKRGITRLIAACRYSFSGLMAAVRHEEAFRQELIICAILVPLSLWLGENGVEKSLLLVSILLVLIVELLNSAIESVVDRLGSEHHELSGRAKDMGSAAVLLAILTAITVWTLILLR